MSDTDLLMRFLEIPLGRSEEVFRRFSSIETAVVRGAGLKRFLYARGWRENKVLLVAHADTYWDQNYGYTDSAPHRAVLSGGVIRSLDSRYGLGADDRAGCAILWLLRDLGHSLLITDGEEHGQQGSSWLMEANQDIAEEINRDHRFVVQFDRRNGNDYKCYRVGTEEFRRYVEQKTGYTEPDRRSSTDIVSICRDITGVNLSIGYRNEHTADECLCLNEWQGTLDVCRRWLSEQKLPRFTRWQQGYERESP